MWLEKIELLKELNIVSVSVKLVLALLLGGLLGLEREQKHRPAGLRTYVLVCLGATLACITNIFMCSIYVGNDPARIPAQVISGMGFLGAGTIIVTRKNQIKGLTTAAGLWCCAAIGIAIGSGFYSGAIITTVLIVGALKILLIVDKMVEDKNPKVRFYIQYDSNTFLREAVKYVRAREYELLGLDIEAGKGDSIMVAVITFAVPKNTDRTLIQKDIENMEGCIILEVIH